MNKSLGVVVVEQLGSLAVMLVYVVVLQHVTMVVLNKKEESWLRQLWSRWLDGRLALERRRWRAWTLKETAVEPNPAE